MIVISAPQRLFGKFSGVIVLVAFAALIFEIPQSGTPDLAIKVLHDLTAWGFLSELALAVGGTIVLSFLAGARKKWVALGAVVVILTANSTMAVLSNSFSTYPTRLGTQSDTLLALAEESPNTAISTQMPTVIRIGEDLGDATLFMPALRVEYQIRAFTDIDVIVAQDSLVLSARGSELRESRFIGFLGETEVWLIGENADTYFWIETSHDSVLIVAEELMPVVAP